LGAADGAPLWEFNCGAAVSAGPALCDGKVVVASLNRKLFCLEVRSGRKLWESQRKAPVLRELVLASNHLLVLTFEGHIECFSMENGEPQWKYEPKDGSCSVPVVMGEHAYWNLPRDLVCCARLSDGSKVWDAKFADDPFHSSGVAAGNRLYLMGCRGRMLLCLFTGDATGKDWPMYGADAGRKRSLGAPSVVPASAKP